MSWYLVLYLKWKTHLANRAGGQGKCLARLLLLLTSQPHPYGKAAFEKAGIRVMSVWVYAAKKDTCISAGIKQNAPTKRECAFIGGDSPLVEAAGIIFDIFIGFIFF